MKVLLTGATGFLGSEIARQLVAAGHDVRVTVRKTSKLDGLAGLAVEKVEADINDREAILRALDGCEAVIHTAANVSMRKRDTASIFKSNVEGAKTVLGAALEKGVKRAVYTSSIAAIGATAEPVLQDEGSPWDCGWTGQQYTIAKKRAEEAVEELARKGLPVVIVNPGTILGPGDVYQSSTRLLREFVSGRVKYVTSGGTSFCDVREVAAAHVAALTRGKVGERYILGGQNFSYLECFETTASLAGLEKPGRVPYPIAWLVGFVSEALSRVVEHSFEDANLAVIRFGTLYGYCDVRKAQKELGYTVRPFEETVRDTLIDHVRRGIVAASTPELVALKNDGAKATPKAEKAQLAAV